MPKPVLGILLAIGLLLIGASAYLFLVKDEEAPAPPPAPIAEVAEEAEEAPPIRHPLPTPQVEPEEPPPEPLPPLDESDPSVREAVTDIVGEEAERRLAMSNGIVRRLVVTVDNLMRPKLAPKVRPVNPVQGGLAVSGDEDDLRLSAENYARYEPLVSVFVNAPTESLIAAYQRHYPLFQEAYEDLGYPDRYFNDRLVEVIDHLLATPEPDEPLALVRPNVFFEYADPDLEALSAGQKTLLRMGPEHATAVKQKLREIRAAITASAPGASAPNP